MASEPIHVKDDSELPHLFDEASERPVRIERHGIVYRLTVDDTTTEYDAEALRTAIDRVSGLFSDDEAQEMIDKVYEWRRLGSRPASRP